MIAKKVETCAPPVGILLSDLVTALYNQCCNCISHRTTPKLLFDPSRTLQLINHRQVLSLVSEGSPTPSDRPSVTQITLRGFERP